MNYIIRFVPIRPAQFVAIKDNKQRQTDRQTNRQTNKNLLTIIVIDIISKAHNRCQYINTVHGPAVHGTYCI